MSGNGRSTRGYSAAAHASDSGSGSPEPTGAKWQKALRGFVVSVIALAGLSLALEAWLRVTGDREAAFAAGVNRTNRRWVALMQAGLFGEVGDPVRRYAMRPGASAEVDGWVFRVSRHRTRGADFPAEKPADERRLLCLGDSFAFGLWADEDETLIGHLARMAEERERARGSNVRWRAVNLGVPGYHSGQQLAAFEQDGLALDPDVVVLYFNTNDIAREGFFLDEELGGLRSDHVPLPTWLRRPLWTSHLYGWIVRAHERSFSVPQPHLDPRVPWAHVRADNQAYTRVAVTRIAELCSERGIPLFFVNQPLFTWSGDARRSDWGVVPLVAWAEELRAELGLPGVSLLGWLRGYGDGVDRFVAGAPDGEQPPADFMPDLYVADEAVQSVARAAERLAAEDGLEWRTVPPDERIGYIERAMQSSDGLPDEPDFHITGEGYAHLARICYPVMAEAGMLP